MKLSKLLLFSGLVALTMSCSKDDEKPQAEPSHLDKVSFSVAENTTVIEVPEALLSSSDSKAQEVVAWIESGNGIMNMFNYFEIPAGATRSSTPIIPSNGRLAAAEYAVYTFSDGQGNSYIYQLSETTDKHTFEYFAKLKDHGSYIRVLYAEEMKDESKGFLDFYDFSESDSHSVVLKYEWSTTNNLFTFKLTMDGLRYEYNIDKITKAGSIKYYLGDKLFQAVSWDNQGNGSWIMYHSDGTTEEGSWKI